MTTSAKSAVKKTSTTNGNAQTKSVLKVTKGGHLTAAASSKNKASAEENKQATALPEKVTGIVEVPGDELPPLEDRLLKLDQLAALQARYIRLKESEKKLKSFKFKAGEEAIKLEIKSGYSTEFQTSNPEVVKTVLSLLADTIKDKYTELEPQIRF